MNPLSYQVYKQGLDEHNHIGQSIFLKYCNMKIHIRFPQPSNSTSAGPGVIPMVPQRYELVWGWVPNTLSKTGSTTPTADKVSVATMNHHINQRVTNYFDERKDKLRFIPKQSTIKIIGRRKVRPDMRHVSTAPPTTIDGVVTDGAIGTIPDYFTNISWKPMRKIHLQRSTDIDDEGDDVLGWYPNLDWFPFCAFVNADHAQLPSGQEIENSCMMAWNSIVYFTDS